MRRPQFGEDIEMTRTSIIAVLGSALAFAASVPSLAAGPVVGDAAFTKRIGVSRLQPPSNRYTTLGDELSDMLTTALVNKGYQVVERGQLSKVIEELSLKDVGGLFDPSKLAAVGKQCGAEAMVMGSISEFGSSTSSRKILGIEIREETARVKLDVRMVDIRTGTVLAAATGEGQEVSRDLNLRRMIDPGSFSMRNDECRDSMQGKAARKAVTNLVKDLDDKLSLVASRPVQAPRLVQQISHTIELEVSGLDKFSTAGLLLKALAGEKGIKSAKNTGWASNVLKAEVDAGDLSSTDVAQMLETAASLKGFGLTVQTVDDNKVVASGK
jgi:curli biogenesis system outer membrane secretion channel CsgG